MYVFQISNSYAEILYNAPLFAKLVNGLVSKLPHKGHLPTTLTCNDAFENPAKTCQLIGLGQKVRKLELVLGLSSQLLVIGF